MIKQEKNKKRITIILISILVLITMHFALKYTILYFDGKAGRPIISKDYLTIRYKDKTYIPYLGNLTLELDDENGVIPSLEGHSLLIRLLEPDYIQEFKDVDCLHLKNGHGIKYEFYCVEGFVLSN